MTDGWPPGAPADVTLVQVLHELADAGYDTDVFVEEPDGLLICARCQTSTRPRDAAVQSMRRLEGASDPADMAAVLAVRCRGCGAGGTAVLRFGPEASPGEAAVLVELAHVSFPVVPPGADTR